MVFDLDLNFTPGIIPPPVRESRGQFLKQNKIAKIINYACVLTDVCYLRHSHRTTDDFAAPC